MGRFTPRPDQAAFYARRAKAQGAQRTERARSLAAWLETHRVCANGCGQPVAFWDEIRYAPKHGACCSPECQAAHEAKLQSATPAAPPADTQRPAR